MALLETSRDRRVGNDGQKSAAREAPATTECGITGDKIV